MTDSATWDADDERDGRGLTIGRVNPDPVDLGGEAAPVTLDSNERTKSR